MTAYRAASADHRVICIDEKGPVAVKTYPGRTWQDEDQRATYAADYGRRGKVWIHGAFEPRTGLATVVVRPRRDSAGHVQLLEQVVRTFPADRWTLIEDNLSIHHSLAARPALAAWDNIRVLFLPKYACWLNLIEPWWKQLDALALRGHRFDTLDELVRTIYQAVAYWNRHRYPYVWGRPRRVRLMVPKTIVRSTYQFEIINTWT